MTEKIDNYLYEEAILRVFNLPSLRWEIFFEEDGDVE